MPQRMSRVFAILLIALLTRSTLPCPFCSALSSTLTEDLRAVQFAFFAKCVQAADINSADAPIHSFELLSELPIPQPLRKPLNTASVVELGVNSLATPTVAGVDSAVVKTELARPQINQTIKVYSLREYSGGDIVLLQGTVQGGLVDWSATESLTQTGIDYLQQLTRPERNDPLNRLRFCLSHLRSPDKLVAADAYNEFAVASLETMYQLKCDLDPHSIKKTIQDTTCASELRRLHWTLLSIIGDDQDLQFVRQQLGMLLEQTSEGFGLDAVFSCYLVLGGEKALQSLETDFLLNDMASYTNCFALITALRIHAEQFKKIPTERVAQSFHYALRQPRLAELVVPDLARWSDWSVINQLVELYLQPGIDNYQHHKIPIVNYLRACPLEAAKSALARCEQADPEPVRRAQVFFPSR